MKNVLVLFSIIIFMTACQKNEITPPNNNEIITNDTPNQSNSLFSYQPSPDQDEIKARINDFRQRLKDAKSGAVSNRDQMTIENAEWSIEANLNATYAQADFAFTKFESREDAFSISVENGTVNDQEILSAYETARTKLRNQVYSVSDDSRQTILVDLELVDLGSNEVSMKIRTFIGKKEEANSVIYQSDCNHYTEANEDFWYWGKGEGRCCCDFDAQGIDATDRLEQDLNERIELPEGHLYFTTVNSTHIDPEGGEPLGYDYFNPNDNIPNDGNRDKIIYWVVGDNFNEAQCISPYDLNWYYCNWRSLITEFTPPNQAFSHIDIIDEIHLVTPTVFFHRANIFHGYYVSCPCPPCPIGEECDCC